MIGVGAVHYRSGFAAKLPVQSHGGTGTYETVSNFDPSDMVEQWSEQTLEQKSSTRDREFDTLEYRRQLYV